MGWGGGQKSAQKVPKKCKRIIWMAPYTTTKKKNICPKQIFSTSDKV